MSHLTRKQYESLGLVVVAFEDWPVVEAAANPDNDDHWFEWANLEIRRNGHGSRWLWEFEHPIVKI